MHVDVASAVGTTAMNISAGAPRGGMEGMRIAVAAAVGAPRPGMPVAGGGRAAWAGQ